MVTRFCSLWDIKKSSAKPSFLQPGKDPFIAAICQAVMWKNGYSDAERNAIQLLSTTCCDMLALTDPK